MNPTAEQLMIAKRLRDLSASWIRTIRQSLQLFSVVPGFHPNYPLPLDFPFSNTPIQEKVHWFEEGSSDSARYKFNVYLEYHLDRALNSFPAIWILRSSDISILGRVEVDYRILHDTESPIRLTADFVLEMMEQSLHFEQPLRLSSRTITNSSDRGGAPTISEIFELRAFSGVLIMEVARRLVKVRNCATCGELLPPTEPHACMAHLSDATSST
ncbi:hypothetical protein AGABI1DRAFT_129676 [Agaricus bisporus var. burnettii JB137-S8]|uniref:Uncharacterized protein n=1 Tax=Agaricus bisporus var. burnettii (strain JB137-S8 / ATCC MYA-4627 / FGSC 10392) TaxID=597362 RepID=K5WR72_AGABU|nr:uncharacterized protein AGABI1DRAFT_129676 [Agaricus bisporus var. burnettii JB137-S8]EKM77881.1 hypothetical protein AGABI1DRAFT_129676 [Agaricus bisporus var. burnettii JB137-S8]